MKRIDLTSQRFGRLIAQRICASMPAGKTTHSRWHCLCDCGNKLSVETQKLQSGHTRSCGCLMIEIAKTIRLTHGHAAEGCTPAYKSWASAKNRCHNPSNRSYSRYGGRGIRMFKRWRDSFQEFIDYMGPKPPRTSLDRIDNSRGYEPGNVRWATGAQQARNTRKNIFVALPDGSKVVLKDYAEMHGIDYHCMYARYVRGKPLV